jgi:hypothetical protein
MFNPPIVLKVMATKTDNKNPLLFTPTTRKEAREVAKMTTSLVVAIKAYKEAQEAADKLKAEVKSRAKMAYWLVNQGTNAENPANHTFDLSCRAGVAQLNFVNKYNLGSDATAAREKVDKLIAILGEDSDMAEFFQQETHVTLDVTGFPEERMTEFANALVELQDEYGLKDGVITDSYIVDNDFHDARHTLSPETNAAVDEVLPMQVQITV